MESGEAFRLREAARRFEQRRRELVDGDGSTPGGGHGSEEAVIEAAENYLAARDELAAAEEAAR